MTPRHDPAAPGAPGAENPDSGASEVQRILEALAGASPDYIVIVGSDLTVAHVNRPPPGFSASEVVGSPVARFIPRAERETVLGKIRTVFETGRAESYDTWAEVGGERREFASRLGPVFDGDTVARVTMVARDVTDERAAQIALREADSRFRAIVENAQAIVFMVAADGRFLLSEGKQLSTLGLEPGEVVGRNAFEMYRDNPEAMKSMTEPLAGREYRGVTPVGDLLFDVVTSPYRDAAGNVIGMVGMGIDVTEHERALISMRESQERHRLLFDRSPYAIVVMDLDTGLFVEANAAAEKLFGMARHELLEVGPAQMSPEKQPDGEPSGPAAAALIGEAVAGGRPRTEWTHTNARGEEIPCDLWLSRLPHMTRTLVQGTIVDLRPRREAEAAQERLAQQLQQASKMQAVGQLTGGIAHDFNNLLTVILGNLEIVRANAELNQEDSDSIASALEAALRGSRLTQKMLAFSRKQPLQPRAMEVNALVAGMEDLLRRTLGETILIRTRLADGIWRCRADPTHVENALLNLAINARDAMPDGGALTITTANAEFEEGDHDGMRGGEYVVVSVTDTGSGIPGELLPQVFDPFFTTKDVGKGSGLGLSMVYGFTRQSGGHVTIESEEGRGTTVTLYLPRDSRAVGVHARDTRADPPGDGPTTGELILVVEDDDQVRRLSVALLQRLGFRVVEAADGREAIELLEAHPEVALLFTDVVLPDGMSGVDVARQAREFRPELKVLFTSGYTDKAVLPEGGVDPSVELLPKPFTIRQLADALARVTGGGSSVD